MMSTEYDEELEEQLESLEQENEIQALENERLHDKLEAKEQELVELRRQYHEAHGWRVREERIPQPYVRTSDGMQMVEFCKEPPMMRDPYRYHLDPYAEEQQCMQMQTYRMPVRELVDEAMNANRAIHELIDYVANSFAPTGQRSEFKMEIAQSLRVKYKLKLMTYVDDNPSPNHKPMPKWNGGPSYV